MHKALPFTLQFFFIHKPLTDDNDKPRQKLWCEEEYSKKPSLSPFIYQQHSVAVFSLLPLLSLLILKTITRFFIATLYTQKYASYKFTTPKNSILRYNCTGIHHVICVQLQLKNLKLLFSHKLLAKQNFTTLLAVCFWCFFCCTISFHKSVIILYHISSICRVHTHTFNAFAQGEYIRAWNFFSSFSCHTIFFLLSNLRRRTMGSDQTKKDFNVKRINV